MEARPRHLAQLGRLRMGVDRLDEELEAGRLDEGTGGRGWEEGAAADGELDLDGLVVAVGFEAGEDELHPALVNESFPLLMLRRQHWSEPFVLAAGHMMPAVV